jgi:sec-independent protein translocase protein TatA
MVLLGWTLGYLEISIIVLVVLILFGPQRLPQLARALGQSIREFRAGNKELGSEDKGKAPKDPGA